LNKILSTFSWSYQSKFGNYTTIIKKELNRKKDD